MDSYRIYIVEDMGVTRAAITNVLNRAGFQVVGSAISAEKAWEEITENSVDLVLLDITLKGPKDGLWLARKIRQTQNCAIVFLTAYGNDAVLKKVHSTNPDGYIMKPFNNPTLLSTVKVALSKFDKQYPAKRPIKKKTATLKTRKGIVKIRSSELIYLQSDSNYVQIYTTSKTHEVRGKLTELLLKSNFANLFRIHRRYAVNADKITSLEKNFVLIAGKGLHASRSFQFEELREFMRLKTKK